MGTPASGIVRQRMCCPVLHQGRRTGNGHTQRSGRPQQGATSRGSVRVLEIHSAGRLTRDSICRLPRQGRDLRLRGRTGPGGAQMFVPHNFAVALLMMITSAVCWGSWANTYKGVKNYRFELFYWDYAVGIFFISLVLAFTLGSTPHDSSSFLSNAGGADGSNIISTLIGGAVFNLANLLPATGGDLAGVGACFSPWLLAHG